ncbi:MAG: 3-isopropylmalate dehydratase small subunit [Spirochaetes bacterium]|nr:3-isopropylmalate dehydratase small subunit [Spirochaetota bacterium]
MKPFGGPALFLDRSDINTDEIIPARYLTESTKEALKPHLLEDLDLPGFDAAVDLACMGVILTRANFGCGSSREHAPWALEVNGINAVIAESFARIFRQNMANGGLLAIELPKPTIEEIFTRFKGKTARVQIDLKASVVEITVDSSVATFPFRLSPFDRALVDAGGWVDFADARY